MDNTETQAVPTVEAPAVEAEVAELVDAVAAEEAKGDFTPPEIVLAARKVIEDLHELFGDSNEKFVLRVEETLEEMLLHGLTEGFLTNDDTVRIAARLQGAAISQLVFDAACGGTFESIRELEKLALSGPAKE